MPEGLMASVEAGGLPLIAVQVAPPSVLRDTPQQVALAYTVPAWAGSKTTALTRPAGNPPWTGVQLPPALVLLKSPEMVPTNTVAGANGLMARSVVNSWVRPS